MGEHLDVKSLAVELDRLRKVKAACLALCSECDAAISCAEGVYTHDDDLEPEPDHHLPTPSSMDEDDAEELRLLEALEKELGDLHLASRRAPFVAANSFTGYCKDSAIDCELIKSDNPLFGCIDWEKWAARCRSGYYSITFKDEEFYYSA